MVKSPPAARLPFHELIEIWPTDYVWIIRIVIGWNPFQRPFRNLEHTKLSAIALNNEF
jgi:hypothetical protein